MIDFIFLCVFHSISITGIGPPKKTTFIGTPPPNSCPVCGIQLSQNDLETHFSAELGRIAKPSSYNERQELRRTLGVEMHVQNNFQGRNSRWEVRVFISYLVRC